MIKIIPPDAYDFGEPPVRLVKLARGGLGLHDRRALVKQASEGFAAKLARLERKPGDEVALNIALSTTEAVGPNRNGDGFRQEWCRRNHDTFRKHAKAFRNHCFPAGTMVLMADRERRPIEDVALGDYVQTLEGPRPVTALFQNEYHGPGIELELDGLERDLVATAEHPVLVLRREQIHCPRHKYCVLHGPLKGRGHFCCREQAERHAALDALSAEYVPIWDVRRGDYLLLPPPKHGDEAVPAEFAELVGWVGSEGYAGRGGNLDFTFAGENQADIAAVVRCLYANGLRPTEYARDDGLSAIHAASGDGGARMYRYVRGIKTRKHLTGRILEWDAASLRRMLVAYIDGDGSVAKATSRNHGKLRIRSSSYQMRMILSDVIRSLGCPAITNVDSPPQPMLSPTNGEIYHGNGSGIVEVSAGWSPEVCQGSRKLAVRGSHRRPKKLEFRGWHLVRVRKRREIEIDEPVYNLEVAGPHHYVANEVVVHNCNRETSPYYGVVKLSHFNEDMQRVELGLVYNGTKAAAERNGGLVADLEMEKLAKGDVFPSSMACLVKKDVCSGCGHEARSRREYCRGPLCKYGGLYDNIGKTFADGHHLHADNPDPDWFDISHIVGGRGADRTSFTLGLVKKAAEKVACGAQIADELGLAVPFLPDLFGPAVARHAKVACELTARDAADRGLALAFAADFSPPPAPAGPAKAAAAFRALADARVVLPVRAFLELAGATPKEAAAAAPAVAALVPDAYAAILADGDAGLASNPFVPAASADSAHRKWASALAASASLEPAAVSRRLALAAVRDASGGGAPRPSTSFPAAAAEPAARAYALYKIAALAAVPEADRGRLMAAARAQDAALA